MRLLSTSRRAGRRGIRSLFRAAGLEVRRIGLDNWSDVRTFIPFSETLAGAKASGLSVADYVDAKHNRPGATQEAVDQMAELGVFRGRIENICEIGPGSGRYLEKILKLCHPNRYEIYETAEEWRDWLARTYPVVEMPTDGRTLAPTPSRSIDLVHAQKVLSSIPMVPSCQYLLEMARVVRDGGKVVFDVVTEGCLDDATIDKWVERRVPWGSYPALLPRQFVIDLLARRGLTLTGSFMIPMAPGRTECMVFTRFPPK
jgi:SAM-dependent methyltransferase